MGKVTTERDEELSLFLEMRRREKENEADNNSINNYTNSNQLDSSSIESNNNNGSSFITKSLSSLPLQWKSRSDEFLNSANDKSDYDWLLTPPGTPLFPSLEAKSQKNCSSQAEDPSACPTYLSSGLADIQIDPTPRSNEVSKDSTLSSRLNSSSNGNRRPSSSGGSTIASRRSSTPTVQLTLPSTTKPSKSSTPSSRVALISTKPAAPPVRSSTPSRSSAQSYTITGRPFQPASKSTARSVTPTRQPSKPLAAPSASVCVSAPAGRSSSVTKSRPATTKNPVPSRGISSTVKSRPWKPSVMPGFALAAPINLKTSLPDRPASASRVRPGTTSVKQSSNAFCSNGKARQQSCSPSRGRASLGSANRNSYSAINKSHSSDSDDVNPVLMGTQMVERVVNMRKLAPPKQDDHHSVHNNYTGKSLSSDSSGFGRTLSKKSLDMAIRHMGIRPSMSGNLRPVVTSVAASSVNSVRSNARNNKNSMSDSPLATGSAVSYEPSVNSGCGFDGSDFEDSMSYDR